MRDRKQKAALGSSVSKTTPGSEDLPGGLGLTSYYRKDGTIGQGHDSRGGGLGGVGTRFQEPSVSVPAVGGDSACEMHGLMARGFTGGGLGLAGGGRVSSITGAICMHGSGTGDILSGFGPGGDPFKIPVPRLQPRATL